MGVWNGCLSFEFSEPEIGDGNFRDSPANFGLSKILPDPR